MDHGKANLAGGAALLLWSSSALLTYYCKGIPLFMLASLSALIGFSIFFFKWRISGESTLAHFRLPLRVIMLAVIGIGGYRLLYFAAFQMAPAVEVNLINYLWPILIVLFTAFLPDEKVRWFHVLGALFGFTGLGILLGDKMGEWGGLNIGHLCALLAAVEWAAFSVISRTTKGYSSNAVPVSFLITGVLFFLLHLGLEDGGSVQPSQWIFVTLLGATAGLGYFFWDIGMKHGNILILGVSSYFVPLLSTILLVVFTAATASPDVIWATVLIFAGSLIASRDKLSGQLARLFPKKG